MKTLIYSLALSLCLEPLLAKEAIKIEKTAHVKIDVAVDADIEIDASNTDVLIDVWDEPRIEVEAVFRFRGTEHEDKIQEFLKTFQQKVSDGVSKSGNSVHINTYHCMPSKVKIGWEDFIIVNTTFSREEVQFQYHIKMPTQGKLKIKHSYRDLRINGDVNLFILNQYSGRFAVNNIKKGELNLHYGKASVQNIDKGSLTLYENDFQAKQLGKMLLNIKYCNLQASSIANLEVEAYESEIEALSIDRMEGNLKYSSVRADRMQELVVISYECRYTIPELKTVTISNSKYSRFEFDKADIITVGVSYEDKVNVGSVIDFNAGNSKYSQHNIGRLEKNYRLEGYECDLNIAKLQGPGGEISINGKYLKVAINTEAAIFDLQASLQYGKLEYPEEAVDGQVMKNGNNTLINLSQKSPIYKKEQAYHILINGYEVKANLY
ncbi:hypothetical protein [Croceimicrobium hydrocarbonivorans]|uniref:Adhesin domain-containing protein n=1 Tax=Croceimicrobium hydrocarbonivorans TaxID=2761580 RepID=A0A7H0VA31_9FLAO|nr:hypothetical protein [Croceimicrobium hydrocarbonivorans]QNR22579.1 hypothetical protein H4K34_09275 [Croceimicrobium hydrocarbonivorans]